MKALALAAVLAAAGLAVSGCGTAGLSSGKTDIVGALQTIASDPRCGHVDRIQGNLGGLTGNNMSVYLERTCPPVLSAPAGVAEPPT